MAVERDGEEPGRQRQQASVNLHLVCVACHSEKVLKHDLVVPQPDQVAVARIVPNHELGFSCRCILHCPLQIDDVLANRLSRPSSSRKWYFPHDQRVMASVGSTASNTNMGEAR